MSPSSGPQGGAPLICPELVELAGAHLEGALAPGSEALVVEHLSRCPHCPRFVRQLELAIALAGQLADERDVTTSPAGALLAAFRSTTGAPGR